MKASKIFITLTLTALTVLTLASCRRGGLSVYVPSGDGYQEYLEMVYDKSYRITKKSNTSKVAYEEDADESYEEDADESYKEASEAPSVPKSVPQIVNSGYSTTEIQEMDFQLSFREQDIFHYDNVNVYDNEAHSHYLLDSIELSEDGELLIIKAHCEYKNGKFKTNKKDVNIYVYSIPDNTITFNSTLYKYSGKVQYGSPERFTNKYGTRDTICAHSGCTKTIATSGDTNCCTTHSSKCGNCGDYIDEDALFCMDCVKQYVDSH